MVEERKRHCWECLRRSLVCDFTQPQCNRCSSSGKLCPGYGEKKPVMLNWLEPGRVKSRTRRKKSVVKQGSKRPEPEIPWSCLRVNADAVMDAIGYYNEVIYPILASGVIANHPGIYKLQPVHIRAGIARPDFLTLDIVCVALNHRIHSSSNSSYAQALIPTYYHYRGQVLRSLNEGIRDEKFQKENLPVLVAGILALLLADARHGASTHWRFHLDGIQQLITLKGGFRAMAAPGVEPLLLCYAFVTVLGDTTSPASDLTMTPSLMAELDTALEDYGNSLYSFYPFPTPLFAAVVRVNHLRSQASTRALLHKNPKDLTSEAEQILATITSFDPESWSDSHPDSNKSITLAAHIVQAAVTVYTISSLQSVSVLPSSAMLNTIYTTTRYLLYTLLRQGLSTPGLSTSIIWPLVVLGVSAVSASAEIREFVRESLEPISRDHGTYVPLLARNMLDRFWKSGETDWDKCWGSDRPVAMAMQWTVNRGDLR
ncbi:fungal-specific transcription factor domain-containing protein [Aspergillus unguis]